MRGGWWLALLSMAVCFGMLLGGVGEQVPISDSRWMFYGPDTDAYYGGNLSWVTPVYPWLLKGMCSLFGHYHRFPLALVQILLWGLAVVAMWRIAVPLAGRWGIAVTAFFALWPPLTVWTLAVYVEPVAICMMVYTALCLYMALRRGGGVSRKWMWLFILCELLLILTRPAFAYVPIATLLTGLPSLWPRVSRRIGRSLLVSGLCGLLFVGGYTAMVYWRTGVVTPSVIGVANRYFMARRAGVINPAFNPDSAQRALIEECLAGDKQLSSLRRQPYRAWREFTMMASMSAPGAEPKPRLDRQASESRRRVPMASLEEMVGRSIAAQQERYWRSVAEAARYDLYAEPLISAGNGWPSRRAAHPLQHWGGRLQLSLGLTLGAGLLWLILLTLAIPVVPLMGPSVRQSSSRLSSRPVLIRAAAAVARRAAARWFPLWLALCCLGNMATIFLGAPYDHSRLFIESVPLLLLLTAIALHALSRRTRPGMAPASK